MSEAERMIELQQQNMLLKQEVENWKLKYYSIKKEYQEAFLNKVKEDAVDNHFMINDHDCQLTENLTNDKENQAIPTEQSEDRTQKQQLSSPILSNGCNNLQPTQEILQTSEVVKQTKSQLNLELISGCFLLEKRRSSNYNPIKLVYPSEIEKDHSNMYDAIYRFIFIDQAIEAIVDDEEQSRKNEIFYGSAYEDFHFVFDDYKNQSLKNISNKFLQETNIMRKQHVFGVVRPEILLINEQYYETQIAFGFISETPVYPLFRDLSRVIQQQIKLNLLKCQNNMEFQDRIAIIGNIITNICKYSVNHNLSINNFPIDLSIDVPLYTISLKFSSTQNFLFDQLNCAQAIIQNYSKKKIIKILHYLLAQKSVVIICKSRKSLNQLFEIIKALIQPLNWIFPIVYSYTQFYQPFLSSPLPIMIGYVKKEYYQDWQAAGDNEEELLLSSDLILIKAENDEKDSNQLDSFEKRIKKCDKWAGKDLKEEAIAKQKLIPNNFVKKVAENKLCFKLHYYVQQLINSTKGKQQDSDEFYQSFKESQLLSYYNQDKNQQ